MKRTFGVTIALWLGLTGSSAEAARATCLQPAEAEALIVAVLPSTLDAVAQRCAPRLPSDAALRGGLPPLAARYHAERTAALQQASVAAAKTMGGDSEGIASSTLVDLFGQLAAREVVKDVKLDSCAKVDRIVGLLAPLPPRNVAALIVTLLSSQPGRKSGPFTLCATDHR